MTPPGKIAHLWLKRSRRREHQNHKSCQDSMDSLLCAGILWVLTWSGGPREPTVVKSQMPKKTRPQPVFRWETLQGTPGMWHKGRPHRKPHWGHHKSAENWWHFSPLLVLERFYWFIASCCSFSHSILFGNPYSITFPSSHLKFH